MCTNDPVDCWCVSPSNDSSYDYAAFPVEKDPQGRKAMEFAQSIVEDQWDQLELDEMDFTVRLWREFLDRDDFDEF